MDAEPSRQDVADLDVSRLDLDRPSVARAYDYYLGGFHNFPVDRDLADKVLTAQPTAAAAARAGRGFLTRAVTHLVADRGVRQFLDLGSGIPTAGNVHEIAQAVDSSARVVYVDIEPVAVSHAEMILADTPHATSMLADLREADRVLSSPAVRDLLDLSQPTALLLNLVMHFVPDADDPAGLIRTYRQALGPGSWLAISHSTHEFQPDSMGTIAKLCDSTITPLRTRTRAEVRALFDGYDLIPPGLVLVEQWQPGNPRTVTDPERYPVWAGVAQAR